MIIECKICNARADRIFFGKVLGKYNVSYHQCLECQFIQTEPPYWLSEAYSDAITDLDVGLVSRNIMLAQRVQDIILSSFKKDPTFLDYAGGYGLFVRLMRDRGFDFYREDIYCENIFAQNYDITDLHDTQSFELVTAFEVFEHLVEPIKEINKIFQYSDTIIFTTELQPKQRMATIDDWWYFTPETGQHISFYSRKTLDCIAEKLQLNFYTFEGLHILTKKKFSNNPLKVNTSHKDTSHLKSLIQTDFNVAKKLSKVSNQTVSEKNEEKKDDLISVDEKTEYTSKLSLMTAKYKISITELQAIEQESYEFKATIDKLLESIEKADENLNISKSEFDALRSERDIAQAELMRTYASREWRFVMKLQKIFKTIFPVSSIRRNTLIALFGITKPFQPSKDVQKKSKSRKKRNINSSSKKLVYIGHSYHNKTKSTIFLQDYLQKHFNVEIISDESWQGKSAPDLSFIDESYFGVIFFQLLPEREIIDTIKNDNILYFPMYDASRHLNREFWKKYKDLKIVNFSRTLHEKLEGWGMETIYVQYFPKIHKFIPGNREGVFFWQRLTRININLIVKLLHNDKAAIHIHKEIDPKQTFLEPTKQQEEKYHISYSEWFETREELWNVIKKNGVYIAPREYEGIGMSFLEPMAMGKAVIAVNNPTMNEYIKHGKTGYLFDLKNPKEIDLGNIEEVQRNTYEFMKKGRETWKKEKKNIISFIKKP